MPFFLPRAEFFEFSRENRYLGLENRLGHFANTSGEARSTEGCGEKLTVALDSSFGIEPSIRLCTDFRDRGCFQGWVGVLYPLTLPAELLGSPWNRAQSIGRKISLRYSGPIIFLIFFSRREKIFRKKFRKKSKFLDPPPKKWNFRFSKKLRNFSLKN